MSSPWRRYGLNFDICEEAIELIVFGNHLSSDDNVACTICLTRLQDMVDAIALDGLRERNAMGTVDLPRCSFPGQCYHGLHIRDLIKDPISLPGLLIPKTSPVAAVPDRSGG
jgi:hypothetical protein